MKNQLGDSPRQFPDSGNGDLMPDQETFPAIPLLSLRPGECAVLDSMRLVPPRLRQRLLELGLIIDAPVELVRFAPLGDPVQLRVDGANISLRRSEVSSITVRKVA